MTKSDREIMEILEAFDLTRCPHSAAALAGCDPKTVSRYVAVREQGGDPTVHVRRPMKVDEHRDKIEELAEMHRKLLTLDDSQVQLCILRCCLGFGKINHLLRTSPPAVVAPVIPEFDSLMQSTLCQTLSVITTV